MSRRHRVLTLLIGSLAATALVVSAGCGDDPDRIVVTEPGSVVTVAVGDELTIELDSNATTGYAWALETPPLADVVRLVDDVYVEPDTDVVGAGGRQEITFEAVGEGTAEIALWYVRSFDDPKEPAERAVFEVVVG